MSPNGGGVGAAGSKEEGYSSPQGVVIRVAFAKNKLFSFPQIAWDVIDIIKSAGAERVGVVAVSQHVERRACKGVAEENPSDLVRRVAAKC